MNRADPARTATIASDAARSRGRRFVLPASAAGMSDGASVGAVGVVWVPVETGPFGGLSRGGG
jgi:hypothetical protein